MAESQNEKAASDEKRCGPGRMVGGGMVGRRALSPCSGGKPLMIPKAMQISCPLRACRVLGIIPSARTGFKLTAWFRRIVLQRALLCIYIYIW